MTCAHCRDAGDFFNERTARRDLRRYRRKGPSKTTALLLDGLRARAPSEPYTLLDVGGGVGAIQHELLDDGAERVLNVDASPGYQAVVREETERRGHGDRIEFYQGDFVDLADEVPEADIVTLDRVICCYPDMPALVAASAGRARRLVGLVFPREHLLSRIGVAAINLFQSLRRSAFRVYVHPRAGVEAQLEDRGFRRAYRATSVLWQVLVFERTDRPPS